MDSQLPPAPDIRGVRIPTLVAHRGDAARAPENTLTAFSLAVGSGAAVIELDVQLSADQIPIVMHDEHVDRTTDGTGAVRAHRSAEIAQLDGGSWFSSQCRGEPVPTLEAVLHWASEVGVGLFIEIKTHPVFDTAAAESVAAVLNRAAPANLYVYSMDHVLIRQLAGLAPSVRYGVSLHERTVLLSAILQSAGAELVTLPSWIITPDMVAEAHGVGCLVCGSVRHLDDLDRYLAWGVDFVINERLTFAAMKEALAQRR